MRSLDDFPGFLWFDAYQAMARPEHVWLIQSLVPYGGWINIYGKPKKARKSYLALGMAWAISSGQSHFLGFPVRHHGPVLYLQVDTPDPTWAQRTKDIASGGYDLSNILFASTATAPYPFNIDAHGEWLANAVDAVDKDGQAPMIFYDTGARMHMEDENSVQGMSMVMNALDEVAGQRAKGLITHQKKGGDSKSTETPEEGDSGLMDGNRGSSAVAGAMDTVIKMTPSGVMQFQGRQAPESHKRLEFTHVHNGAHPCPYDNTGDCMGWMWTADTESHEEKAKKLIRTYKQGSVHSVARLLHRSSGMSEEAARSLIRRLKQKGGIE